MECLLRKQAQFLVMSLPSLFPTLTIQLKKIVLSSLDGRTRRKLLIVAHADRGDRIRIISARELTPRERKAYEEENN